MKSRVEELTLQTFPDEFDTPSVILLSREGCHLCDKLKPIYDKISALEKYDGVYNFYVIDADKQPLLYKNFMSDGVPTLYVIFEEQGTEIPYPENPAPSGYGEKYIINFQSGVNI